MPKKPGKVRRCMPTRQVKTRNLGNLHVIDTNVAADFGCPTGSANIAIVTQEPTAGDASSIQTVVTPVKLRTFPSPLKEKPQQKGGLSLAKKVIDKAKSFLTDLELQSTSKETCKKSSVAKNIASRQRKGAKNTFNTSNNLKNAPVTKGNIGSRPFKKIQDPLKYFNPNQKKTPTGRQNQPKAPESKSSDGHFSGRGEKRVVRMKPTTSDSRRDVKEHDMRRGPVTRQSASRYPREFLEHRVVSKKDAYVRDYEEERKRGGRRFSSRREEEKYYEERYLSSRRERGKRSRNYQWDDSDFRDASEYHHWYKKEYPSRHQSCKEIDNLEEVSDGPLDEMDFEEVEVASVEEAEKATETPVGFRKYRTKYLDYKQCNFFKPKIFNICSERTVVNCLNVKTNNAVEVDVVSEADYECEADALKKNQNNKAKNSDGIDRDGADNSSDNKVNEKLNECEVKTEVVSEEDRVSGSEIVVKEETNVVDIPVVDLSLEESCGEEVKAVDSSLLKGAETASSSVIKDSNSVCCIESVHQDVEKIADVKCVEEEATDTNSAMEIVTKDVDSVESSSAATATDLVENENTSPSSVQNQNATDTFNKIVSTELEDSRTDSTSRVYGKCTPEEDTNQDFYQGAAKIQSHLDAWKSHLIGLEYVIEIRDNTNEAKVKKYHCWLCSEDIWCEGTVGQTVIGHINSYKHMLDYMAKHFPSCGYKFSESTRSYNSEIILRKCGEEINQKIGYYFMCITNCDYFSNHRDDVDKILGAFLIKTDIDIDVNLHLKGHESVVSKEVGVLMNDILGQIAPVKGISTFISVSRKTRRSNVLKDLHSSNSNEVIAVDGSIEGRNLILLTPSEPPPLPNIPIPIIANAPFVSSLPKMPIIGKAPFVSSLPPLHNNLVQIPVQDATPMQLEPPPPVDVASSVESESTKQSSPNEKNNSGVAAPAPVKDKAVPQSLFNFHRRQANSFRKYRFLHGSSGRKNPDTQAAKKVVNENVPEGNLGAPESKDKAAPDEQASTASDSNENEELSPSAAGAADIEADLIIEEEEEESANRESDPEIEIIPIESVENEAAYKSKTNKQRSHQKSTLHSRYCIKRILGKSSKSHKETPTKKDAASKESNSLSSVREAAFSEDSHSSSVRMIDELLSQDSRHSHSSKSGRKEKGHSNRSSRSPSLPYRLLKRLSRSRSRSPKKRSVSPLKIRSSPHRRLSRSPLRFNRNSTKRRSPNRRYSRSPNRRASRSPNRRASRSPIRRRSRSPISRRSRSPIRRRSRSPIRKRSRSPLRRRSRSPVRRRSRSPLRRRSRSPLRKRSRSPFRLTSQLPVRQRSRSPFRRASRRLSKSPVKRKSKSPIRRSPPKRHSSKDSRSTGRSLSSYWRDASPPKSSKRPESASGTHRSSNYSVPSSKHKESEVGRHLSDLDSISDEDESTYFATNEKSQHLEEIMKLPPQTRSMIMQLLKKNSGSTSSTSDPILSELMQVVNTGSSDGSQHFAGLQSPSVMSQSIAERQASGRNLRESFRKQFISNLIGVAHNPVMPFPTPVPGASGIPFPPPSVAMPAFQPPSVQPQFPVAGMPSHAFPQHGLHQHMPLQGNQFAGIHQQNQPPRQVRAPSEVVFKDLKATVNKLFGASEVATQGGSKESVPYHSMSGFPVAEPGKWDPPTVPQVDFYNQDSSAPKSHNYPKPGHSHYKSPGLPEAPTVHRLPVPPPDAKVSFCDMPSASSNRNLFPVVSKPDIMSHGGGSRNVQSNVSVAKISLAQRLAAVLVKYGMVDVPASLLQEMLMKIGAFSVNTIQDINEAEIVDILKRLRYL